MHRRLIAIVLTATIAGCATPSDTEHSGEQWDTIVDAPPAVVYRQLVSRARTCYAHALFRLEADFFPDNSTGRITLSTQSSDVLLATRNTMAVVTLSQASGGRTRVDIRHQNPLGLEAGRRVYRDGFGEWAHGRPGTCAG
jgi:hypothetical protein